MNNSKKQKLHQGIHKTSIHIALFLYWVILVAWQNTGEYSAGSSLDTLLKTGLLICLLLSYLFNVKRVRLKAVPFIMILFFAFTQFLTFTSEQSFGLGTIVAYIFPTLFIFLSFVFGVDIKLKKKQYISFLNAVIAVVAYASIYALIFKSEQFASAFSISSAYGNELSSFFMSSHEYGMYLFGGIVSCIVCLEFKKEAPFSKKLIYLLFLALFVPNLILTFSRTSILAMTAFLLIYVFFRGKSKMQVGLIIFLLVFVFLFLVWGDFRYFLLAIVFKGNNTAGRDELFSLAVEYFKDGTLWQQLFGRGINETRKFFEDRLSYGSVHNAYLQVLLYYGICGLGFMICFLFSRLRAAIKLMRKDKFIGALSLGLVASCAMLMFPNTSILFNSPIDSFFLTMFTIVVPKYLENGLSDEMGHSAHSV